MLQANAPAPTIAVDEDDELFLSFANVGMPMRPDLFDPHSVHWHGFPQAAPVFDGVPDSSISINMGVGARSREGAAGWHLAGRRGSEG